MEKLVYSFNEATKEILGELGPRGRNLVKMLELGIPVPFGFTILPEAAENITDEVREAIHNKISELEEVAGKGFGNESSPLLVSVRSGKGISMPGTLEGILNVGLSDEEAKQFPKLKSVLADEFSLEPYEQLEAAIKRVYSSWEKPEAFFRNMKTDAGDNSIIVQQMVYGDKDDNSFSAIVSTRNLETGENAITCEYKVNASFEDLLKSKENLGFADLEKQFPYEAAKIVKICRILEDSYKNVQTIFIVCESGRLYVLKSDIAGMSPEAKARAAREMVSEGLIGKKDAVMRIEPGEIELGEIEPGEIEGLTTEDARAILSWADEFKSLKVRANVDNAEDAELALTLGAQGIGLVRTEHMFDTEQKLTAIRKMILSETDEKRSEALAEILNFHKKDIKKIFEVMEDRPVTIRLLDMPFAYFFPTDDEEIKQLAAQVHIAYDKLGAIIDRLKEENPMLGTRGARLNIIYPEVARMQAEAIARAAIEVKKEKGVDVSPEILVPMIATEEEFFFVADVVKQALDETLAAAASEAAQQPFGKAFDTAAAAEALDIKFLIGSMIEIPRAAIVADKLAERAMSFSIGTNDLTQMVYGISRVDTDQIIKEYEKKGIFKENPFKTLDLEGVAPLIESAIKKGRKVKENIRTGVCGEHASDPKSIEFFQEINLGYISCSPKDVPKARLAAAQAAISQREKQ